MCLPSSATPMAGSYQTLHEVCSRARAGRACFHGLNGISGDNALFADSQFADDLAVTVCVALFQVVEQTATLADQH